MTIEGSTAIVLAYVLVSMGVIIAFLLAVFHRSAAPAPPRTARRTVTYEASYPALAKDAHHPTGGRAGSDEKLDGLGFDEQIFGADKQVPGRGQSD